MNAPPSVSVKCAGSVDIRPSSHSTESSGIERLLDRTTDIRIAEDKHGPAEDRHYQYVPTFILRGLTELHVEFAP
jgi:hypothetical protein